MSLIFSAGVSPSSEVSSGSTFHTAKESSDNSSTAASSPVQTTSCPYRQARGLSRELKQHCQIFLEEQLYSCAINLLSSVLASSHSSNRSSTGRPVSIPPPSHLALLSTLIVHPLYTTRADKHENLEISSLALSYLRSLLSVVGPVNANFRTAFQFHVPSRRNRRSDIYGSDVSGDEGESDRDEDRVRGRLANEGSLWCRGQNFWATVGWAFNCSTMYPKRWQYWRCWLEFMLDALQLDWEERERMDETAQKEEVAPAATTTPKKKKMTASTTSTTTTAARAESMIVMYMDSHGGRGPKGIMKALFADGGHLSSSAFQEVFDKEPKGPKKESNKRKRDTGLDLENDQFGDYFDEESMSSGASEPPTPHKPKDGRSGGVPFGAAHPGFAESISLRLRLFKLLSAATHALRKPSDLDSLYEAFAHDVKVLPLQTFSLVVSQRPNPLMEASHTTLLRYLFQLLLPSTARDPRRVDKEAHELGDMSAVMLEQCFAPYPANTIGLEDNAKLSLAVESAVQLLWNWEALQYSDSFATAIETGIKAREVKATKKRTGKVKAEAGDELAQQILEGSALRIRLLVECMELSAGLNES